MTAPSGERHLHVVVLGAGEVGRMYALLASTSGATAVLDPFAGAAVRDELTSQGITVHDSAGEWLRGARRIWSCVPGDLALSALQGVIENLAPETIYVDLTTASPADKRAAANQAAAAGVAYVDVAIMGAVALTATDTPLMVAGSNAAAVTAEFTALGAAATTIAGGSVGDAVQLKLLRTVITKGLEALAVDAFTSADSRGLHEALIGALADIDERGFTAFLDAVVRTHPQHAERRMREIDRAIAQLEADGVSSSALRGARSTFSSTVRGGR